MGIIHVLFSMIHFHCFHQFFDTVSWEVDPGGKESYCSLSKRFALEKKVEG